MNNPSVQEVRANLSSYLKRAEAGDVIKITRRGNEVAVLISLDAYKQLTEPRPNFTSALARFYERHGEPESDLNAVFEGLRDRSDGRLVNFD